MKRIFLVVLDSVGIGELPDAKEYNDEGSHTLYGASKSEFFNMPNMEKLGLFNITGVKERFQNMDLSKGFDGSIVDSPRIKRILDRALKSYNFKITFTIHGFKDDRNLEKNRQEGTV